MLARLLVLLLVGLCTTVEITAFAQNPFDPGGGSGDSPFDGSSPFDPGNGGMGAPSPTFGGASDAGSASGVTTAAEENDPIVRIVRETPPTNPTEMAEAITWLTRIGRWDEVGRQLEALSGWNTSQKAALSRAAGPSIWFRLKARDVALTDAQRATLLEVLQAPGNQARQPQWINSWIAKLGSQSAGERELAQLRLQDAGRKGIEVLVNRILSGSEPIRPAILAQTVAAYGPGGIEALRTACVVSDPERAGRIHLALADLAGNDFAVQLGAGLTSQQLNPQTQAELTSKLANRFGSLPTNEAINAFLVQDFETKLQEYTLARLESKEFLVNVWQLSPDGNSLVSTEAPYSHLALRKLSNVSMLMLQQQATTRENQVLATAALLQESYQARPELLATEQDQRIASALGDIASQSDFWQQLFDEASERQLHGAALRAMQLMSDNILPGEAPLGFLTRVLKDPRPAIRFAAVDAIGKLDPLQPFSGADLTIQNALEMSRLANGPHVLVIGLQAQIRQAAQQQLRQSLDAEVTSVNSARAALIALQENVPYELVVIVDRVNDQSLRELVQRLRMTRRAGALPIAILTDDLTSGEQQLMNSIPGIVTSVLSRNPEQMDRVVELMTQKMDTEMLNVADRAYYSIAGKKLLARIAGDSDQYGFYHVDDYREQLVAITHDMQVENQVQLLSGLGNATSQAELFDMAADLALSEEQRNLASSRFAQSVNKFGMLLSREQVQACYDIYNRLGPVDPISVRVLGSILDTIEARATGR